jgi:phosphoribosylformimino-5-aminoimidazole carboxamide ribotide isomerase
VARICQSVSIPVQVGGGLRTLADLRAVFAAGASRAILGTAAFARDLLRAALAEFGDRIAVALDARDGLVAIEGWRQVSAISVLDAAQALEQAGVRRFIYTDVARDGMLAGPDLAGLLSLSAAIRVPVILSGGIATIDDLRAAAVAGAEGAIVGRALYDGQIALADALRAVAGAA